ncbi:hypothetical protein [Streptomyces sp. NPDC005009]
MVRREPDRRQMGEGRSTNWPAGEAAFVTGAASGIGLGVSRALVAAGVKVIGVSLLVPDTVATRVNATAAQAEARLLGRDVRAEVVAANNAMLAQGADPDRVGEQVLEAMRERRFLIVTHRDFEPLVSRVHAEIERAFREFDDRNGPDAAARTLLEGRNPVSS